MPQEVFQLGDALTRDGGDKYVRNGREGRLDMVAKLAVKEVGLADGQQSAFIEELGVVLAKFLEEDVVLAVDVVGVGGDEEKEDGVALDVTEES